MSSAWKEAATVILTTLRTAKNNSVFNYDLLSIKRSAKNSFMPGMYVFPGGGTHEADDSKRWLEMFNDCNIKVDTKLSGTIPPILMSNGDNLKLVSLKITAIRETFEETGILLCTQGRDSGDRISVFAKEDLSSWRSKVESDASEFYNLCQHYKCCPDINKLHLWSNWLTPKTKKKRFDTIFFIGALADKPTSAADKNEIDEIVWNPPNELIDQNKNGKIVLAPPQLYEISRLLHFTNGDDLIKFGRERAIQGCERWMSYYLKANNGMILTLPGDDGYKVESYDGLDVPVDVIDMTMEEFRLKCNALHRIEGKKIIVQNYQPKNGHILPKT